MFVKKTCRAGTTVCVAFVIGCAFGCGKSNKEGRIDVGAISAEEARDALVAMVIADPDLTRVHGLNKWDEIKRNDADDVDIGWFHCHLRQQIWTLYVESDRHDFDYRGRFVRNGDTWTAIVEHTVHVFKR
jgi:hypothetical protein